MFKVLHKIFFFVVALPVILRASFRVSRAYHRHPLDELPDKLRAVPGFAWGFLNHAAYLNGSVGRLLCCLPPFGMGPCLKRSLLLLDLWSRCGLTPTLTLGVAKDEGKNRFHAWVTCDAKNHQGHRGYDILWTQ